MGICGTVRSLVGAAFGVVATAAFAQSADAPNDDGPEDFIMGAWSDPANCNLESAVSVSIRQVVAQASTLNGKCVAVDGFWVGRAVFSRARDGNADRSNVDKAFRGRRIGIYARDEVLKAAPVKSARHTIVGIVGRCETAWPDAVMAMGYCHYTEGPFLMVSQAIPQVH